MKKHNFFIFIAEPHPILFKDSERRVKRQIKNAVFIFDFSEPQFVRIVSHENEKLKSKNSCALWIFCRS